MKMKERKRNRWIEEIEEANNVDSFLVIYKANLSYAIPI